MELILTTPYILSFSSFDRLATKCLEPLLRCSESKNTNSGLYGSSLSERTLAISIRAATPPALSSAPILPLYESYLAENITVLSFGFASFLFTIIFLPLNSTFSFF